MKELLSVWRQEYRNILADNGVLSLFVGAVFFYSIFYPIPYSNEVLKKAPLAVVDLDHTSMSRKLIRMIDATDAINVVARPESQVEAERLFFERKIHGILIIPNEFERKISRKEQANVAAYSDASYFLIYRRIMTGITQACGTLSAGIEIKRMQASTFGESQAKEARDSLPLVTVPLFNPSGGYASYVIPAVLVIILQQTLLMGIGMLSGTANENYMQPASGIKKTENVVTTLLGKAGAYLTIYICNSAYYLLVLPRLYRLPQHVEPFGLLIFVIPFLLAVIFMGMSLSGLFQHRESSMLALLFTSLPSLFLVGFSWPKESIPAWLHILSYLLPSTAGIDGILRINQMGATLKDVRTDWSILCCLCIVYFFMACIVRHNYADKHCHEI